MGGGFHMDNPNADRAWAVGVIWLNCLIGGCAMIPPLANIVEIPTAKIFLVKIRNHLNRMLTVDVSNDSNLTRKESFICDLNGRIATYQLHVDLGEQILLLHNDSMSDILQNHSGTHGMKISKFQVVTEQCIEY